MGRYWNVPAVVNDGWVVGVEAYCWPAVCATGLGVGLLTSELPFGYAPMTLSNDSWLSMTMTKCWIWFRLVVAVAETEMLLLAGVTVNTSLRTFMVVLMPAVFTASGVR